MEKNELFQTPNSDNLKLFKHLPRVGILHPTTTDG